MNIHNCHFIGATGLYPIEEIITNTSNDLIANDRYNSNNLINYNILTSNNLINYTLGTYKWYDYTNYLQYSNIQVYNDDIRILTPLDNYYLRYEFINNPYAISQNKFLLDSSGNNRSLTNYGGIYQYNNTRNSISFTPTKYATIPQTDWSTLTDLSLSFWINTNNFQNSDEILDFTITETISQFPPSAMTSMISSINGITYRACSYSFYDNSYQPFNIFDKTSGRFTNTYASTSLYTASGTLNTGTGVSFGTDTFKGFYVGIDMGQKIVMKNYTITERTNFAHRRPKTWKIYGTNNDACWNLTGGTNSTASFNTVGNDWVEIDSRVSQTSYTSSTVFQLTTNTTPYRYYAMNVNELIGTTNANYLDIGEWYINGYVPMNIRLLKSNNNLIFQINNVSVYQTPYTFDNSWNYILWNILNNTQKSYIKINNTKVSYNKVSLYSTSYTNYLSSATNVGSLNIADFCIYTNPLTSAIEETLYQPYTNFVKYTDIINTTLPINNFDVKHETRLGNNYNWNEEVLEPFSHLSSVHQVYDNTISAELDFSLFRYYYLTKNELRELKTRTIVPSYNPTLYNGIYYPTYIYYYEDIKKWFGYVGWNQSPDITKGGFKMVSDDTTATNIYINISLLISFPDEYLFGNWVNTISTMPIITAWDTDNTKRTFRIIFGINHNISSTSRFITVEYADFNNTNNTDANYNRIEANRYYLPTDITFEQYHYYSFNISKTYFVIYRDGVLVFVSPTITYTNPNNFTFSVKQLYLEDRNFYLNDGNQNRFQFADLYYFKRYLTNNEILQLSNYHLSSLKNVLRVFGTIECDRIITNQIVDYDYTEKNFKDMVWKISQTSNLQNLLDSKENTLTFTPDRVIVSDPNSPIGKLTVSSITSNNLEDMQNLIRSYNPVIEFIKHTFQSDIASFIESNPNIITLGVSAGSALYTWITGGLNAFNANNRIPRRYITDWQDADGDLRIFYPYLTNDNSARIYITETFKTNYIYNKQPLITGGATTITNDNLTPNKVLISNGDGKVSTSNNIDLEKLSYLNNVNSDIQTQINNKQPNLTVSTDSIVSIVNNIINTEWKKSGSDITYNTGNIIVDKIKMDTELKVCDPTFYCSNEYVRVIGKTELNNTNSINDYGILNPLLLSLTKRVVFELDNMGNIKTKELISNTTFNYSYADYLDGIYAGHVQNGSGNLYVYDLNISSYPLDTQSASVSFWCYSPNNMVLYGEYRYCRIFQIDQDKLNILNYDRPKIRVLLGQGYNTLLALYENIIDVQYTYSGSTWFSMFDPAPSIGTSPSKTGIDADLKIPRFYSFNFTYNSCTLFVNGIQVATNTVVMPQYEFRLENFFFPQSPHNDAFPALQNYRFWNVYMNYNRLYTANEVASLYRYETDSLMNTLRVNGIIRTTALATDTIYLKGQEFNLPSSYNQKSLFEQDQETGKITVQTKTNNRRSLSIDTTEVNTVQNIINNTGNSGFWYYANNNQDTQAQIKTIEIADVNTLSTTLGNKLNNTATANSVMITDASGNIIPSTTISTTELGYLDNTSKNIETNFTNTSNWVAFLRDNKLNNTATANSVMITDASGNIIPSTTISTTELGYLDNTSKNIETNFTNTSNWVAFLRDSKLNSSGFIVNSVLCTDASGNVIIHPSIHTTELSYLDGTTTNINTNFTNTSNWVAFLRDNKENTITTLPVSKGGTGKSTITASRLLGCISADTVDEISLGTNLSFNVATKTLNATAGSDTRWTSGTGILYLTTTTNRVGIGLTNPNASYKLDVLGNINSSATISANSFTGNGSAITSLSADNISTGTLTVARGGTGKTTITASRLLGCLTANTVDEISIGTNLSFNVATKTLNATAGSDTRWTTINTNDLYLTSASGSIGIGTNAIPVSRLTILPQVIDRSTYNHGLAPCTITHQTATSTTVLNDPKEILNLCRQGTASQAYGARSTFKLCRWENNGLNSRTRLDIAVAESTYTDVDVISIRSDGRVGIGKTNPTTALDVNGTITGTHAGNGSAITNINAGNISTGTLSVARGGTSISTIVANRLLGSGGTADTIQAISLTSPLTLSNGVLSLANDGWTQNTSGIYYNPSVVPVGNTAYVGIGTATPKTNLHVQGGFYLNSGNNWQTAMSLGNDVSDGGGGFKSAGMTFGCSTNYVCGANNLGFYYTTATNAFAMVITEGQNVGIGLGQNPNITKKLQIGGDAIANNFALPTSGASGVYWDGVISALGRAQAGGHYSTDAVAGDVILRAENRVLIQSGSGAAGIKITSSSLQTGVIEAYGRINAYQTSGASISVSGVLRMTNSGSSTNYWDIVAGSLDSGNYPNVGNLNFGAGGITVGYVEDDLTNSWKMNHTSQHRTITDDKDLYSSNYIGYIVSASGKYKAINSKYGRNNIKQNIIINDALPIVELTSKAFDPCVFGVVSDRMEDEISAYSSGHFVSLYDKDAGDNRLVCNGGGEGSIWVCSIGGTITNGDYLCSSIVPGLAMKQPDDLLHNYTCAKITMDCDFEPQLIPVEVIKQEEYYIGSNIFSSNMLDNNGNPIYEYKLDESSNIIYDYEYEVKTVMHNEIEYKMAFVGCSYKCS